MITETNVLPSHKYSLLDVTPKKEILFKVYKEQWAKDKRNFIANPKKKLKQILAQIAYRASLKQKYAQERWERSLFNPERLLFKNSMPVKGGTTLRWVASAAQMPQKGMLNV